jgi:hypothetical protein
VDVILALVGLGALIWAFSSLFSPAKKHKEFSLHDRDQATMYVKRDGVKSSLFTIDFQKKYA